MNTLEKIRLKMQRRTNLRNTARLFVAFTSGIISGISGSWTIFFILITAYCLFEMGLLFSMSRSRFLYEKRFTSDSDNYMHNGRGESLNYAFKYSLKKFLRSFILLSILGGLTKMLVGFFYFSI